MSDIWGIQQIHCTECTWATPKLDEEERSLYQIQGMQETGHWPTDRDIDSYLKNMITAHVAVFHPEKFEGGIEVAEKAKQVPHIAWFMEPGNIASITEGMEDE